jgi:hypothetical protein
MTEAQAEGGPRFGNVHPEKAAAEENAGLRSPRPRWRQSIGWRSFELLWQIIMDDAALPLVPSLQPGLPILPAPIALLAVRRGHPRPREDETDGRH